MITDNRCESVKSMESSDAVEDTFEATIVTATVIFVVVVVILTVSVVICMLCRSVPKQVEEGGGRKQTNNFMERAQDLHRASCTRTLHMSTSMSQTAMRQCGIVTSRISEVL